MSADIRRFGTTSTGDLVEAVTLRAGELTARLITFGASLQDLRLAGTPWPLILGSDTLSAYESGALAWAGAVVGPVANRLSGAQVEIAGQLWRAAPNDGANLLHSGDAGCSQQVWAIETANADSVTFRLDLPHGAAALPGNRVLRASYQIVAPSTLEITLSAETDAETLMNLAHHPYWNLDGTPTTAAHHLKVAAEQMLPCDAQNLPRAPISVADTVYDLHHARRVADLPPLDNNYCLPGTGLRAVAELTGSAGVSLTIETDAPGLQVYDGQHMGAHPVLGLSGAAYGPHAGLALEPQMWPDAPQHPDFPAITLHPGETWRQVTRLHLSRSISTDKPARTAL
ncbi:aldose 1-epimerase [Rhodobacter sp. JA431]|uniref:aldose epimerase family protein n=1 Tax=Rhodobacter sp. JA431 TaxID=570013 RepID=UPI000BC67538|nr:aldose epimerase family protein [Rhodobacter sp. JA431]SOC04605.1 aldose 1-epimerase [Rhodobacter sp. JA431]